jgi:hypothetical protein
MDWSKFPLEKLFFFVAGILPGFVALLIFHFAVPGSFAWFFTMSGLGYKTKLSLVLLAAFVAGNTMTTFLNSLLSAVGFLVGSVMGLRPYKPSHSYSIAPWRDERWRTLLNRQLGSQAPNDTRPMPQELFDLRRKLIEHLPEGQRQKALADLQLERINAGIDDSKWAQWYDHYHQIVLQPEDRDFVSHVRSGLNFNLQTASLYVLLSALVVPAVRRWWCILPACAWVLLLIGEAFWIMKRFTDKWSTLSEQMRYLEGGGRDAESRHSSPA